MDQLNRQIKIIINPNNHAIFLGTKQIRRIDCFQKHLVSDKKQATSSYCKGIFSKQFIIQDYFIFLESTRYLHIFIIKVLFFQNSHQNNHICYLNTCVQYLIIILYYCKAIKNKMQKNPRCICNSQATLICANKNCQKAGPFFCNNDNSNCFLYHKDCSVKQWKSFKIKLDEKYKESNSDFVSLCENMNQMIEETIKQLNEIKVDFNNWKKQYGVIEKIKEFYKCIQRNEEVILSGKEIHNLMFEKKIKFYTQKMDDQKMKQNILKLRPNINYYLKRMRKIYTKQNKQTLKSEIIAIKSRYLKNLITKLKQSKLQPEKLILKFVNNYLYRVYIIDYVVVNYLTSSQRNNQSIMQMFQIKMIIIGDIEQIESPQIFQKFNFRKLVILKIYFAGWLLYKNIYYRHLCDSLRRLPKLERFIAVVSEIQSEESFKKLGIRLEVMTDIQWHQKQQWQQ